MICEKCEKDIETVLCKGCGGTIIKLGHYCYACGNELEEPVEEKEETDFSNRILCSDGTCIGIVDEKGICKICGKPYTPEA